MEETGRHEEPKGGERTSRGVKHGAQSNEEQRHEAAGEEPREGRPRKAAREKQRRAKRSETKNQSRAHAPPRGDAASQAERAKTARETATESTEAQENRLAERGEEKSEESDNTGGGGGEKKRARERTSKGLRVGHQTLEENPARSRATCAEELWSSLSHNVTFTD
ncbi:unnamed protein product [Arctogadus glacialis]